MAVRPRAWPWPAFWPPSGHAATTDRSRSRLSDFDAHMVKPVDPAKLFSAIES